LARRGLIKKVCDFSERLTEYCVRALLCGSRALQAPEDHRLQIIPLWHFVALLKFVHDLRAARAAQVHEQYVRSTTSVMSPFISSSLKRPAACMRSAWPGACVPLRRSSVQ